MRNGKLTPLTRMLSSEEAFAEVEYKCSLYDMPGLILGASQMEFGHMDIARLTAVEKMWIAALVRPAISEIEHHLEWKKRKIKDGAPGDEPH